MSDFILHGVLNLPPELWDNGFIDEQQRYSRYVQASKRIRDLNKALLALSRAYSDWPMNVSDEDETLISRLINEAEG